MPDESELTPATAADKLNDARIHIDLGVEAIAEVGDWALGIHLQLLQLGINEDAYSLAGGQALSLVADILRVADRIRDVQGTVQAIIRNNGG